MAEAILRGPYNDRPVNLSSTNNKQASTLPLYDCDRPESTYRDPRNVLASQRMVQVLRGA